MNRDQWIKYNRNIIDRGNGITFTYRQASLLVRLLDDVSRFALIMQAESSLSTFDDPDVFASAFLDLCRTCDELDTKFTYKLQDQLNGKRG